MDLIDAAKSGNLERVLKFLECGYAANTRDKDNATALYWSACHGHNDVTEIIISAGCDVNSAVRWGSTALHAAADRGHLECVQILINSGANPNSTNNRGDTPLHIASYRGFTEITRLLLLAGSNVNMRNEKGKIPQDEAMEGGNRDIAECIRVFVTEGHFSLPNGAQQSPVTMRNNNRQAFHSSRLQNLTTFRQGSRDSVTSDDSSDVSESMTSSIFTSGSSFPEDIIDAGEVNGFRSTSTAHRIKRSVSFGGITHYSNRITPSKPHSPTPIRISSAENIHSQEPGIGHMIRNNDVIMRYSTYNCAQIERPYVLDSNEHQNGILDNHVPIMTTRPISSTKQGMCNATESIDYSHVGNAPFPGLNIPAGLNGVRPLRSSVGSMREIARYDHNESLMILQSQLVESYKYIEVLTKENEHLKFKSSTLLERLTETERHLSEMTTRYESLANNFENGKHPMAGLENKQAMIKVRSVLDTCVSIQGFEELAKRFEDKPTELNERLKGTVKALALKFLYTPNIMDEEWLPGVDYVILGDPPISAPINEHIPKFVSFLVKHLKTNKCFILKMLIELQTPEAITSVSLQTKSKETDSPAIKLQPRPNLLKVLHLFEAPTDRLKKFVYIPPPPRDSNLPQQKLTDRTTFIVTPYMMTLRKLIDMCNDGQLVSNDNGINTMFWLHVLYQLSSVLCLVEHRGESLVDISEDTVGFDDELVPYLKNIENVIDIGVCSSAGSRTVLKSRNLLTEEKRDAMDAFCDIKSETVTAITKLCKLFHEVLCESNTGKLPLIVPTRHEHVTPVIQIRTSFCRILTDAKEPTSLLFNESNTAINISKRFGFLLFGPDCDSITNKAECFLYHQSRMLNLLIEIPACKRSTNQDGVILAMEESVANNNIPMKAHYLCHVSPHELWSSYQTFEQNGLLVK